MEVAVGVYPGLFKSRNRLIVIFLPYCNHKGLILDGPAIAQHNFVSIWVELPHAVVVRRGVVLAEEGAGCTTELELGDAE